MVFLLSRMGVGGEPRLGIGIELIGSLFSQATSWVRYAESQKADLQLNPGTPRAANRSQARAMPPSLPGCSRPSTPADLVKLALAPAWGVAEHRAAIPKLLGSLTGTPVLHHRTNDVGAFQPQGAERSPRSRNEYISLPTTSVPSPMQTKQFGDFQQRCADLSMPARRKCSGHASTACQRRVWSGNKSTMPRRLWS